MQVGKVNRLNQLEGAVRDRLGVLLR